MDGRLTQTELRQVALSIIGQCFLYRAAGDVVEMLVSHEELESHHALVPLADHVTRYALAALGLSPPLTVGLPCASPTRTTRNIKA